MVIRDNDIHDSLTGVAAASGVAVRIEDNRLSGNVMALSVAGDSTVRGNTLTANETAILVAGHSPTLEGNEINGNGVGLMIGLATPTLIGNSVCDNATNLSLAGDRESPDTAGNEICPDAPATGSGG